MAFSVGVADRISFGNHKCVILNLTDVQTDGTSTYKVGQTVYAVKAINNTDTTNTFKETVGAESAQSTRNQVTFTADTADDDGLAFIWYK